MNSVTSSATHTIDSAARSLKQGVRTVSEEGEEIANRVIGATKAANKWTHDHPIQVMLIAGGIGLALGAIARHKLSG